ncbi:ABC transporter ATP-binding protein [Pseudomonas nicosulfuronedens]
MSLIVVNNLGKSFRNYRSELQRIARWFYLPVSPSEEHWVVRNISFTVEAGEAIGFVGQNGAGKSTLLKMITGTLQPTEGSVQINGRVAAILELGMGFSPELTGRQNVYHASGLMGFSAEKIEQNLQEIQAFADIGEYFDEPVRTYSSGMQVRLAFSVATAVRPDILIVDEALAVGDAAFQRKCYRRIEEFQEKGTTLLLVTHDIETVKKICNKALFLQHGGVVAYGPAKNVCDTYEKALFGNAKLASKTSQPHEAKPLVDPSLMSDCEVAYGDGRAVIESIWLESTEGQMANVFGIQDKLILKYNVRFNDAASDVVFAFMVKTREGVALLGMDTSHIQEIKNRHFNAGENILIRFELENFFAPGNYYLNCGVRDDSGDTPAFLHRRVDTALFRVRSSEESFAKSGLINAPVKFSMEDA